MGVIRCATAIAVALCASLLVADPAPPAGADGTPAWVLSSSSDTGTTLTNLLYADACAGGANCVAVGNSTTSTGTAQTLVEEWNGTGWSIVPSPDTSADLANTLYGVSCASADRCVAVGTSTSALGQTQTLAEAWNGSAWSLTPTPDTSSGFDNTLSGVSCASASSCTAVGYAATATGSVTLVESWNGSTWSIVASPDQSGTDDDSLDAVSCPTATSCTAVGDVVSGSGVLQTLVTVWDGATLSVVASPDTADDQTNTLDSVSCTAVTACTAVGAAYAPGGTAYGTLAESWDGATWSLATTPDVTTSDNELLGVSCNSASDCTAAGYSTTAAGIQQALVETWNGSNWSVVPTPEPGDYGNSLQGVACAGAGACAAVGSEESVPGVLQTVADTTFTPPTLTVPPTATFDYGAEGSLAVSATGGPAPTFTSSGAPSGVSIDPASGVLAGVPSELGTFPVTITASNGVAPATSAVVELSVVGLQITTTSLPPATRGAEYGFRLSSSGGVGTLTWKKEGKFPKGIKLEKTGVLVGKPSTKLVPGSYTVTVSVSEVTAAGKQKASASFSLLVQ